VDRELTEDWEASSGIDRAHSLFRRPVVGWSVGSGVLVALVLALHFTIGWRQLLQPWGDLTGWRVAAALLLVLASYAIRTIRVHRFFQPDTSGAFLRSFRLILLHNLFKNLLPMRSGEASFPILMRRNFGVPFGRSIPGLFYLRLLDLHFLLLLAGSILLSRRGPEGWLAVAALASLPFLFFFLQERLRPRIGEGTGKVRLVLARAMAGLPSSFSLFFATVFWTAVNWAVKLAVFAWILLSFTPMPFSTALMGSVTGEVSSVLPFHGVAGAGTYEAGILAGLVPLGVDLQEGVRGAVNLHLFVLGASVIAGGLALLGSFLPGVRALSTVAGHETPRGGSDERL
jgi:uncharacterized membrane protein YbhN (UPF0104 family)